MGHQQRSCASLVFKKDAEKAKQYSLSAMDVVVIGRSPDCQIILDSFKFITVSRRHAMIKRVDSHWEIEDLNTTNGTFVNNLPIIGSKRLKSGDRIILGTQGPELTFECWVLSETAVIAPMTTNAQVQESQTTSNADAPAIPPQLKAQKPGAAKTKTFKTTLQTEAKATILQPVSSAHVLPKTLWNLVAVTERSQFPGHSTPVLALAFSPDGQILASAAQDRTIKLWHRTTQTEIATWSGHKLAAQGLAFSPDSQILASGSADQTIKLWQVQTQAEIASFSAHNLAISALAFSPDGQILASGSADQTIKLWQVQTQAEMATLAGHKQSIGALAFSPDGNTLASGSIDQTIVLWGVATKVKIAAIATPHWQTGAIAFAPDGQTIGACDESGIIRLWQICSSLK